MSIKSLEQGRFCTGYFQETDLSSAVTCPGIGSVVQLQAEGDDLRYRLDGEDPTGSVGTLLPENTTHTINVGDGNIHRIKVIQVTASGILNVHSFR